MRTATVLAVLTVVSLFTRRSVADDVARVREAVQKCTLDQPGTKPFHLKAFIMPVRPDAPDAREETATIEIWWMSPAIGRREIKSPRFSQVEIVYAGNDWQKNDGDYFPEWLREASLSVVQPVPQLDKVLEKIKGAEVKAMFGMTHYSWVETGTDGTVSEGLGQALAIRADGEYEDGAGIGWSSSFNRTREGDEGMLNFHGRRIARKIGSAEIATLEDLKNPAPDLFSLPPAPSAPLLKTIVLDELEERKNLQPVAAVAWPPVTQGLLQGVALAEVVIGRDGAIHETLLLLSDNPGLNATVKEAIARMHFKPVLLNGQPVQVVTTITMPFKTVRPAGVEDFGPSKAYFDRARTLAYPTAEAGPPYVLTAEFEMGIGNGQIGKGTYSDTWLNDREWKREAVIETSRLARSRDGEQRYRVSQGSDANLLDLVLDALEPVPDTESWFEPEWRFTHENLDGVETIRIARGPEANIDGFWFDQSGRLIKIHARGLDYRFMNFEEFGGRQIPRLVGVYRGTGLALRIRVTNVQAPGAAAAATFAIKGHESNQQFGPERR